MRGTTRGAAALLVFAIVSGCGSSAVATARPSQARLVVFAAASLSTALATAVPEFEQTHPGVTLTVSPGASSALRVQIEQGAPADVFLSADTVNATALVGEKLTNGGATPFAGNELTVIVPASNRAGITSPADLARPGVRVVAAGSQVPITRYAEQVVANLARQPGYPANFAAKYESNVVSHEDDVSAVVAKVALGEGDAAIVYVTDAKASTEVHAIPLPAAANVPATYDGVVIGTSAHLADAHAFLAWLAGPPGRSVLARFGFLPPP